MSKKSIMIRVDRETANIMRATIPKAKSDNQRVRHLLENNDDLEHIEKRVDKAGKFIYGGLWQKIGKKK